MQKYKVLVIQLALKGNKVAKSGDEVSEAQLTGNPADLVKNGFIEKAEKSTKKEDTASKSEDKAPAKKTASKAPSKK